MKRFPRYYFDAGLSVFLLLALAAHYARIVTGSEDSTLIIIATIAGTLPVLWNAALALREREWASMDMLASVALLFSIIDLQWASAAFIALMLAAARVLGGLTEARTRKSIEGLLKLRPTTAKIERDGKVVPVPLGRVAVGDTVLCDIGERIPVDGTIVAGDASIDESSLTGESMPVEKQVGSAVMSSTLVSSGSIRIKVERIGKDTTLEKIIALVEQAQSEKPKTQTLGETFGKAYLICILIASAGILVYTHDVPLVLAVVLVVCADDVAIAIPLAYLRAIGAAATRGVIIKGGKHLETLGKASVVVFDKTGTLTKGALAVSDVVAAPGVTRAAVLKAGALASRRSKHPLSKALVAYADGQGIAQTFPDSFEQISGKGVIAYAGSERSVAGNMAFMDSLHIAVTPELVAQAQTLQDKGQTVFYIAQGREALGFAAIADELKHNASQTVTELKSLGVRKVVMLTGDNERVGRAIAERLHLDDFHAGLLPEGKVELIKKYRGDGAVVMVGDGVNDAAALSAADVGIAMGGGYDAAIESAEVVLMRDDLMQIPNTMRLARMVHTISVQDFWIWGITNVVGLLLVFAGFIGPVGAASYNFISDFFPIGNSWRVRVMRRAARRKALVKAVVK